MNTQYIRAWKVGTCSLLLIGLLVATMMPAEVTASGTSGFAEEETIPFGLRSAITRTLARDAHPEYRLAGSSAQEAKLTAGDGEAADFFGISVAFEGNTALVGAINATVDGNDNQGAVYVFTYSDGTWSEQVKLTASDGAANDRFGAKVALSNDTAVIGAWGVTVDGNSDQGAAYVFTRSDNTWSEQAKLVATDGANGNRFGESLALMNDTVLVGVARALVDDNVFQGAAYVFARDGGIWSEQAKLTASDGASMAWFGASVALFEDIALIGSNRATVDGNALQGAAYVFTRSGDDWDEQAKLTASDGAPTQLFGNSVSLSHDTALIGAPLVAVDGNTNQGAAYVYTRTGEDWAEQTKLTASDGAASDQFGLSLDIHDDTALVAASFADVDGMINRGAAYVFTRSDEVWSEQTKLTASDGAAGDRFAVSVAFFDATALIGAQQADVEGNINQGAAYVFALENGEPGSSVLDVDPDIADFGDTAIGDSADSQTVTLSSVGTAPVEVVAIDDATAPFARIGGDCDPVPFTLDPSEECTLEYTFTPTTKGSFEQMLTVTSNADPASFTLIGEGVEPPLPVAEIVPDAFHFVVDVGDTDGDVLTVGNSGEAVLTWNIVTAGATSAADVVWSDVAVTLYSTSRSFCDEPGEVDWLDVTPEDGATPPGESDDVAVTVDAAGLVPGSHFAALCVATNDPSAALVQLPVTLTVTDPTLGLLAGTVASAGYCAENPGSVAGATVTISGATEVFVTTTDDNGFYSIELSTDENPFDLTFSAEDYFEGHEDGVMITAGETTIVDFDLVLGTPCATVDPDSIAAFVSEGGSGSTSLVIGNLDGAAGLDWSIETVDPTGGLPGTVQFPNSAAGPAECGNPTAIPWLGIDPAAGSTIAGGETTVEVTFDAAKLAPDEYEARICVHSNDPVNPLLSVPVTVTVTERPMGILAVDPSDLAFGSIEVGTFATLSFTISNVGKEGSDDLELTAIDPTGNAAFSIGGGDCSAGTVLAPQQSCTVDVGFGPDSQGSFTSTVEVETADGQTAAITLSGSAVDPDDDLFRDRFESAL